MNIVQVSSYYPPHLGGQEQRVRDLSERLAKKGHQVEVFTSDVGCPKDKQLKSTKNLKIHYLPAKEIAHTPIIPSLYNELMKIPQDSIVHVHVAQAYVPEVVYKVCKKRKIPYIAHVRVDSKPSSFIGKIFLPFYKRIILKKFLKKSNKIITLTKDYKDLIIEKYLIEKNKIKVIPNGFQKSLLVKNKKNNLINHLLYVGRISRDKNLPLLLNSLVISKYKFILDIVGDGELFEETKRLAKEKGLTNVIFHGRKEGKELINLYKNADIFISTTRQESFGTVYLEAMASALPIITSNVLGVRNVVKNGYSGILCKQTPEAFAEAIEKLIKNPKLREKLARNGLKEVKKYSWDKIVEQTERIYKENIQELH